MDKTYEQRYAVVEETHPWFTARRDLFAWMAGHDSQTRILDIGCGTGAFLVHLKTLGFQNIAGVETSSALRQRFRDPSIKLFSQLPDGPFDSIFMLDVLEHIPNDQETLAIVNGMLEPGGRFYISVPAHPFLWSIHDENNHHERRYRFEELRTKLSNAGFRVCRISYWNMFVFPIVCLRHFLRLGDRSEELERGSAPALWIYDRLLKIENRLVKRNSLPVGMSLIAVCEKQNASGS